MDFVGSSDPKITEKKNALVSSLASFLALKMAEEMKCKSMVVEKLQQQLEAYGG